MRRVAKPQFDTLGVYSLCVDSYRDEELKKRFNSVRATINQSAVDYEAHGLTPEFHKIAPTTNVAGKVTSAEMKGLYDNKLVQARRSRTQVYDVLLAAAQICPLCGQRPVSTLDHYLPKSNFPSLAVLPVNLIPSCLACNKDKGADSPKKAEDQTFHPYFDDWGGERWLVAEIQFGPIATFGVRPPAGWPDVRKHRAKAHLKAFGLPLLYSLNAGSEMIDIRHQLALVYKAEGASGVRAHLEGVAESTRVVRPNSWKTAMYEACAASTWFCDGGFGGGS